MSKQIAAPGVSNGVYGSDGVFYPNGSTPPKAVADEITNPRAWAGDSEEYAEEEVVVGAPTPEQLEAAEALAKRQAQTVPENSGQALASDDSGSGTKPAAKKAPAKKSAAKKAPAKRASSSS